MLQFLLNDQRLSLGLKSISHNTLRISGETLLPYEEVPLKLSLRGTEISFIFEGIERRICFPRKPIAFLPDTDSSTANHCLTCKVLYDDATTTWMYHRCWELHSIPLVVETDTNTLPVTLDEACRLFLD
jgi:hypothetical protein